MGVAPDPVPLPADDQRHLRVRLQAQEAVDDVDALAFQGAGPLDVALLVEAGLQLDQDRDLLALLAGLQEGLDHGEFRPTR